MINGDGKAEGSNLCFDRESIAGGVCQLTRGHVGPHWGHGQAYSWPQNAQGETLPTIEEMCGSIDFGTPTPHLDWYEWRSIATAPEGEDVLVFLPDASGEYQRMVCHLIDGDWYQQDADQCPQPLDCDPTHWMPLPPEPQS